MTNFDAFLEIRRQAAQAHVNGQAGPLDQMAATACPASFFPPHGGHEEGAYRELVLPPQPGRVSLAERAALALRGALIEGDAALAAHYRALLAAAGTAEEIDSFCGLFDARL